jgi:molybdopterin converting factor small subunit
MTAGTVNLLLFARYAELLGHRQLELEVGLDETVATLLSRVRATLPGAGELPASVLVAVNQQQVPLGHPVVPGDEVALLPPLAGG